ncbi:hypothetical protein [Paractinoplanes rishiriensis]|uniref:Mycolysin n=1 Tax=Paractinoplanes rishiriensis TaxID=1050105 RepID=A0A919K7B4_9ACTN|nr:hypothetical protein [Actinoplanes rishiriensis]GIE99843.1 hypothetical protein Ari01nite_73080 [Actinoplanes rishiriensis]
MFRTPLFILVAATAAFGLPSAAQAEPADECVLPASTHRSTLDEQHGCLTVDAALDAAPSVGETATFTYEVRSAIADDAVTLSVELPPGLRWRSAPAGTTLSTRESLAPQARGTVQRVEMTRAFAAGESLRLTGTVSATASGPAEIQARATAEVDSGTEAGGDDVLLTVAAAGAESRLGIVSSNRAAAVRYQGSAPVVAAGETKAADGRLTPPSADERAPEPSDRSGEPAGERAGTEPAVAGTSCVTGSWNFVDHKGVARAARQWQVQAWDDDASTGNGNDFLASGLTGFDGRYTLCFTSTDVGGAGSQDVYLVFIADNGSWRVQSPWGTYNYGSGVMWNVPTGTKEVGWLQPGDPTHMRGAHAFEAVSDAWNGTPGACWDLIGACRPVVVNWAPGSTDGTYYSLGDNQVHLAAADPDSRHTVVHEAGHSIMDDVFDDAYPSTPSCNPHYIKKVSSQGCAWTEGFAEWFPAQIYNDPYFRWPNGSSVNLETPTWGSLLWANGDRVEGRVAGALIDLADSHNDGTDAYAEGMYNIWTTFQRHNSPHFRQFWTDRGADGFSVGNAPLNSLYQNTIDY